MTPLTYVYGLVVSDRKPSLARTPAGLPGASRLRLLEVDRGRYLIVADVLARDYGEQSINQRLSNLDWVSRTAMAHEAVLEAFAARATVLPMKLFTIFTSDDRAIADVVRQRPRIEMLVKRVGGHDEFGVRVVMDRVKAAASQRPRRKRGRQSSSSGLAYLTRKRAQRDSAAELAAHARETVADLYDRLAARARLAQRRSAGELPVEHGPLLLDAAFLVPRARARAFRSEVARAARSLAKRGYGVTLTGPWPPYTFVQE
jgi:gas vesicle protein GvpL/GvpF